MDWWTVGPSDGDPAGGIVRGDEVAAWTRGGGARRVHRVHGWVCVRELAVVNGILTTYFFVAVLGPGSWVRECVRGSCEAVAGIAH